MQSPCFQDRLHIQTFSEDYIAITFSLFWAPWEVAPSNRHCKAPKFVILKASPDCSRAAALQADLQAPLWWATVERVFQLTDLVLPLHLHTAAVLPILSTWHRGVKPLKQSWQCFTGNFEVFKGGIHLHYPHAWPLVLVTLWTLPLKSLGLELSFGFSEWQQKLLHNPINPAAGALIKKDLEVLQSISSF